MHCLCPGYVLEGKREQELPVAGYVVFLKDVDVECRVLFSLVRPQASTRKVWR